VCVCVCVCGTATLAINHDVLYVAGLTERVLTRLTPLLCWQYSLRSDLIAVINITVTVHGFIT